MQAVILAAGHGRRLRPYTADRTKGMVELHGRTLLERSLDAIVAVGVSRIVLVVGYRQEGVRSRLGDRHQGVPIVYVENPEHATTNNIHSLHLAREYLKADDSLLLESDLVYDGQILRDLVARPEPAVAVVDSYQPWMEGTVVTVSAEGVITQMIPGSAFVAADAHRYFKTVNIYKFSRAYLVDTYLPFLDAYVRVMGRSEYYEQVLRVLTTLDQQQLVAMPVAGRQWYEIDDVQDLQNAETVFAPLERRHAAHAERHGGYWRFPDLVDHCLLVNPYYPPTGMVEELQAGVPALVTQYPSGAAVIDGLAARMFGLSADQVVTGNGAGELIAALGRVWNTDPVVLARPTFEEYAARFATIDVEPGDQANLRSTPADLLAAADGVVPVPPVVLVNPDNPSGACLSSREVLDLASALRTRGAYLVLDESFVDFADPSHCRSMLRATDLLEAPNVVVVRSVSKSHGVPGLRLGVIASADERLLALVRAELPVWNVNSLAELFLQIVPKYESQYETACSQIRDARAELYAGLSALAPLQVLPSQANYLSFRLNGSITAAELCTRLLEHHRILAKDLSGKPGIEGEWVRVAVRTVEENARLVAAVSRELG